MGALSRLGFRRAHPLGEAVLTASAFVFALGALGCGSVGPTAKPKQRHSDVDLDMSCEPSLVYECEELCNGGDLGACEVAGVAYFEGKAVEPDAERAWRLSERACNEQRRVACGTLGKLAQDGHKEAPAEVTAERLRQGCDGEDADSCLRFGLLLLAGSGTRQDPARAHELFQKACTRDHVRACYELGVSARTGRGGFAKDPARAAQLFTLSCNREIGDACHQIGTMQWHGNGAARDAVRAVQNLERGCELASANACDELGRLHEAGRGITHDVAKAAGLYAKACELGLPDACARRGALLRDGKGIEADPAQAFAAFEKTCTSGDTNGCVAMGRMLREGPNGFRKDLAAAARTFQAACDAGNDEGCGFLGVHKWKGEGVPMDREEARPLLQRGCRTSAPTPACVALASALARGIGGKPDTAKAHALASDACAKDHPDGCAVLGELTAFGEGTAKSPHGAAKLFQKACDLSSKDGCVGLALLGLQGVGDVSAAVGRLGPLCEQQQHSQACIALGRALQLGKGVPRDRERAFRLFKERCDAGNQEACARQGYMHMSGRGADKSEATGRKLIEASCKAGDPAGCFYKTRLDGVSADEKVRLLREACAGHLAEACAEIEQ